jgi:hypothetical protein
MFEQIGYYLENYTAQTIFFLVFAVAFTPVLYYYRRRNPNPRFRPGWGEMTLMTVFALALSIGMAVGLGGLFNKGHEISKLKEKAKKEDFTTSTIDGPAGGAGKAEKGKSGKDKDKEFVQYLLQNRGR